MQECLFATNLVKKYKRRTIVDEVALRVAPAQAVGLLGPNGAGKTTCFYMIIGLIRADKGNIFLNGNDISNLSIAARARLGLAYLPQEASIFRQLSVRDNILAILQLSGKLTRRDQNLRAQSLMEEFGIAHIAATRGIALSGGERRRTEIARALAIEPRYILLDEPFAGVDPLAVAEINSMIAKLTARNIGVLITDHNVRETLKSCHYAYILSEGKILTAGSPKEIVNNDAARRAYLGENFNLN